jgi:hypothetical protein
LPSHAKSIGEMPGAGRDLPFLLAGQVLAGKSGKGLGLVIADMQYWLGGIHRLEPGKCHSMPLAVLVPPVSRRLPPFRLHDIPAFRQPQRRRRVTTSTDELHPLAICHQVTRYTHRRNQSVVPRRLIIEAETGTLVADCMNTSRHVDAIVAVNAPRTGACAGHLPRRIINRVGRVMSEGVQDVRDQQFLMLLFVVEANLENSKDLGGIGVTDFFNQTRHSGVDMGTILRDLLAVWPGDQAPLRARVTGTRRDVVGIEQERKPLIEDSIARIVRHQQKLLEEPRDMCAVPFGRRGIRHRLYNLVFSREARGATFGLGPDMAESVAPEPPCLARPGLVSTPRHSCATRDRENCGTRHGRPLRYDQR